VIVNVRVPATTSNLGAGFDCVGVAVGRWLRLSAQLAETGVRIERHGTLRELTLPPEQDLLIAGFAAACGAAGRPVPAGLAFRAISDIPIARGLGSSAAALVAGAVAADRLLQLELSNDALTAIAARVEGHPDNVTAAVRGGATLAVARADGGYTTRALVVHPSLVLVFAVPDFPVATERARAALPAFLPHPAAALAASRAAALVAGLATGDRALLAAGLADELHVPFRRAFVPGYDVVTAAAVAAGAAGATLAGSGSSVVAVASIERAEAAGAAMVRAWRAAGIAADTFSSRPDTVRGYEAMRRPTTGDVPSSLEV
jgi:homoserine kinase